MIKNINLYAIVDTVQIENSYSNFVSIEEIDIEEMNYVKQYSDNISKQVRTIVLNLNRLNSRYSSIKKLSEFNKELKSIMQVLNIKTLDDVKLKRIDIAIDSDLDFNKNYKLWQFLLQVLSYDDKKAEKWNTENLKTMKKVQVYSKGRSVDITIYDKNYESNGNHEANTRIEIRYKRLGKQGQGTNIDIKEQVKKLIKQLSHIEDNIESLEKNTARMLIDRWNEEKSKYEKLTLSEFYRRYDNYFYTSNIAKMVYQESGLKGSYTKWVAKLKVNSSNNIKYYTKTDMVKFKKAMTKALKEYIKN